VIKQAVTATVENTTAMKATGRSVDFFFGSSTVVISG